jgi:biopolymer transport protein TolR
MRYTGRAARMERHHKRHKRGAPLNLVSLMDIFTILVFFLLVNSGDVQTLQNVGDVRLPESIAKDPARETVVVLITNDEVLVQGRAVGRIDDLLASSALVIPALKAELERETQRALRAPGSEGEARREVTIMGDKAIPYRLLKKVMATCTDAHYGRVSLAVLEKEAEAASTPRGA